MAPKLVAPYHDAPLRDLADRHPARPSGSPPGRRPRAAARRWLGGLGVALTLLVAQAASAREFTLDGVVDEWTDADRIDAIPGYGVGGFTLYGYHDQALGKYHLAIVSPDPIGPSSTIWLDTDKNSSTGYQVWGSYVGAEMNININWDGTPHLYSGADAEVWQAGPLSHAFNADRTVFELEFTHGMVGANTTIRAWMDVNNATFLPSWFGGGGYLIDDVGVPAPPTAPNGAITLDGNMADWTLQDRLDRLPGTSVLGYEVYGRADADTYYLALRALPPAPAIGAGTTFWLNTDLDRATGHQVWDIAVGAEHNVNIAADGTPHLYTGAAAQNWQIGPLPHARSADGMVLEVAVSRALLDPAAKTIDVSVDVNDAIFLPADFTGAGHRLYHPDDLPAPSGDGQIRVGIVYSATSAAAYFGDKAYSQLFAAMQHQAMLAGVPFTLLTEDDLLDVNKVKDFKVLLLPYFANVQPTKVDAIADVLTRLVYHYGVGLVTVGNFLTNGPDGAALPGDSYGRMKRLFGLTLDGYWGPKDHQIVAGKGHPILGSYAPGQLLGDYPSGYLLFFRRYDSVATQIANATSLDASPAAIWATTTGARSVHFASPSVAGDVDLVANALRWSIFGDAPGVGLQLTRHPSIFIGRCDMDQSQYVDEAPIVYGKLLPILEKWKTEFNFVSSYYVNVGNNVGQGEVTDWSYSGPVYQQILKLGNEIGTHSYTHPEYTTTLTAAQLKFEFETSRDVIAKNIGQPVLSAAVPGNPESLAVDWELNRYFTYASADFSGTGAGYHGAMGWLSPAYDMIYLAPNMYFDFTLVSFKKYTLDQSLVIWKQQFDQLTAHAPGAFVVWPWHDYGPTAYEPGYKEVLFTDFLRYAHDKGTEFLTGLQAAQRIISFRRSGLRVTPVDAESVWVDVDSDANAGAYALSVRPPAGMVIASVDGWPAYTADQVFAGEGSRGYLVRFGASQLNEARIESLPMRASLISAESTATGIRFQFRGRGDVVVSLAAGRNTVTGRCGDAMVTGSRSTTITFGTEGTHSCELDFGASTDIGAGRAL